MVHLFGYAVSRISKSICAFGKEVFIGLGQKKMVLNQRGFTLIEVIVVCAMLGVLAAVAVPRFTGSMILANTTKIKSDLQTLDAAIVMYEAEKGTSPTELEQLQEYVLDVQNLKPPKGKCYVKESEVLEVTAASYTIASVTSGGSTGTRALCMGKTAGDFGK